MQKVVSFLRYFDLSTTPICLNYFILHIKLRTDDLKLKLIDYIKPKKIQCVAKDWLLFFVISLNKRNLTELITITWIQLVSKWLPFPTIQSPKRALKFLLIGRRSSADNRCRLKCSDFFSNLKILYSTVY